MKRLFTGTLFLMPGATTLVAQEHAAEGAAPTGPLVVNGGLMIWTLVVFLLLMFVLKKFAWPAILGAVREREEALERQIAEAEKNRAESAALLEQHKKLLAEARAQGQGMLAEAKLAAEKERTLAMDRTRQEQAELLERARRDIAAEKDRAIQELRREAVDLSLAAASRLIGQRLTSDTDRKLVEGYLESLERRK